MAMRYPPEWIEELRSRADIVSIISEYVPLRQNGRSFKGLCPFHQEKTPSFHVDPDKGLYHCFGCKAGGSVFQFVMAQERMEFYEALRYLAEKLSVPLPQQIDDGEERHRRSIRERIYELNRWAAHIFHETLYHPAGAGILQYFHGRGLDDPTIRTFGLGAAPSGWDTLTNRLLSEGATMEELLSAGLTVKRGDKHFDMFRGRAMFPIINAHGAVMGFGGRAMGDQQPKYLNTSDTPAFNKRMNVYAQNHLRKARNLRRVLLVEGYMDVVSLVAHGVEGVVATLGTALTPEQAKLIKRYAPEIHVAYDGDRAGQQAILRALDVFDAEGIPARVLAFPEGMDPDDFIKAHGREAFDGLPPLSAPQYRIERAADGLDLSREEDRTQYAIACAAILRTVRQPVEVENLLKRLTIATGFSREVLLQQMGAAPSPKPMYTPVQKREKLPVADAQFLPETMKAERTLLSLLGAGLLPEGIIGPDGFRDPAHREIATMLLSGKSPAALVEGCEDEVMRAMMLDVFSQDARLFEETPMALIAQCMEAMHRGFIIERIHALTESLKTAAGADKISMLREIQSLNQDMERMRPGRKE